MKAHLMEGFPSQDQIPALLLFASMVQADLSSVRKVAELASSPGNPSPRTPKDTIAS